MAAINRSIRVVYQSWLNIVVMPAPRFPRLFLHIVIWIAVYLLPFFISYGKITSQIIFGGPGDWLHIISTVLLVAYTYFNYNVLVPQLYFPHKYLGYVAVVLLSLAIVILFPHVIHPHQQHPFQSLPPRFSGPPPFGRPPSEGPPSTEISKVGYNIVLFIISTFAGISIRQQQRLLEAQREKLDVELSFLKAQINPHFLFNTLNSIYALAIRKSDDTPQAIIQLSELMRYMLKDADAATVPLDKELTYISNYVALQRRRLGNTVQIDYLPVAGHTHYRIAPLILMSFIENAFKHGVNPDQESAIFIAIAVQSNQLHLLVRNNKVTSVSSSEGMGIGSKNTTSRLAHLYPDKHELQVKDEAKTYSVNLTLDLND